jgi:hypothetical protein
LLSVSHEWGEGDKREREREREELIIFRITEVGRGG